MLQPMDHMPGETDIIIKRPHFNLRDGKVYFLDSRKPVHTPTALARDILRLLDRPLNIVDLNQHLGMPALEAVAELAGHGICDVIAPVPDTNRRRVLVLEPHGDDAALSIGGVMWQARTQIEFKLVTLASWSNYTSSFQTGRPFFDRRVVSDLRAAEGEIFMRHLGGKYATLGLSEATMRFHDADWSENFFQDHRAASSIATNRRAGADILTEWQAAIRALIVSDQPEEIWAPLGAGTHSDHDLTRNAFLSVCLDPPIPDLRIRLYQDVPYDQEFSAHTARILSSLQDQGAVLQPDHADIDGLLERKLSLLSIYASQFKTKMVREGVIASGNAGQETGLWEHLWQVERLPNSLDMDALYVWAPEILAIKGRLPTWLDSAAEARRLRILALAPSGRWQKDLSTLRSLFPKAQIDVFCSPAAHAEIAGGPDTVQVRQISKGSSSWAMLAIRLACAPPAHTLFIAGDRYAQARQLARLWPFSRTLVVEALEHLTDAL